MKLTKKRLEELERDQAELRRTMEVEQTIEDTLGLDLKGVELMIVNHTDHHGVGLHAKASVSLGISLVQWLEVLAILGDRVAVVPLISAERYQPVWMPEAINHLAGKPDSQNHGNSQIGMSQSGGVGFVSRQLNLWVGGGEAGWLEVYASITDLPMAWQVHAGDFKFSPLDGSATSFKTSEPQALQGGRLFRPLSSSWRYAYQWDSVAGFIEQAEKYGQTNTKKQ